MKTFRYAFGDPTKTEIYPGIALKEECGKGNLSISKCAFEYSYHMFSKYEVTADKVTGTYTYGEKIKDGNPHASEIDECQNQGNLGDRYGDVFCYARIDAFPSNEISINDEIEITRAIGRIYVYTPAE